MSKETEDATCEGNRGKAPSLPAVPTIITVPTFRNVSEASLWHRTFGSYHARFNSATYAAKEADTALEMWRERNTGGFDPIQEERKAKQ